MKDLTPFLVRMYNSTKMTFLYILHALTMTRHHCSLKCRNGGKDLLPPTAL